MIDMRVVINVGILILLSIICDGNQELKLIEDLNDFFSFDHNVLIVESPAQVNRFISSKAASLTLFVLSSDENSTDFANSDLQTEIWSKNIFLIIVLETTSFDRNLEFFIRLKRIQRLQKNMKIGIFYKQFISLDDMKPLVRTVSLASKIMNEVETMLNDFRISET